MEQLQSKLFRLPLQVDVVTSAGTERTRVDVRKAEHRFSFPYSGTLKYVVLDADNILLGTKTEDKPDEWWASQYLNSTLYLDKKEALENCMKLQDSVSLSALYAALNDPFWKIQEQALDAVPKLAGSFNDLENVLKNLATSSNKPQVKGKALTALCKNFNPESHKALLESALTGDSYLVTASALESYSYLNPETAVEKCKSLETETNYNVTGAITRIYSQFGGAEQQSYFEEPSG